MSKAKPQGKQCQMCIHISMPFPGAARLALQVSHPKLWVAEQRQQLATRRMLCAGMAGACLQQGGDVFGLSGGKVRPKAHLFIRRQKPKPWSPQLLSSGCLRHSHPQSQLGGGASSCHNPWGHTLAKGVRDGPDLLVSSRQMDTHHTTEHSCPLLCQQILPSSHLPTTGILRGRKEEPASQGA